MKPDAIFRCLKSYKGKNQEGKPVRFEEGKEYMRTTVDMKQMGHGSKEITYFLHDWDNPSGSNVEMSPDEFNPLIGEYLDQGRILG